MSSKALFWIATIIILGAQIALGIYYIDIDIKLFIIIESFAILTGCLFIWLYILLIKPFNIISDGIDLLKAQDFSSRLREVNNVEANKVVGVFNQMMAQLKDERLHVREQNHFLDLLINASPLGFIIFDFDDNITQMNPAGIRLLNITDSTQVIGKKLDECEISIGKALLQLKECNDVIIRPSGVTMLHCTRSSFIDRGFPHPFILIEELTHELLKTEKKSYESIIRMMAHEVNNSVAAVSSTLNVISDVLKTTPNNELYDVLPAVDASMNRCIHLSRFISNFADVVKIPPPTLSKINLNELVYSVERVSAIECKKKNIQLILNLTDISCNVLADGIQLEQVLINIVKNACEAIKQNGEICITTYSSPYMIQIDNNGERISKEVEKNLFTPFFTTKSNGQGIGLMFIREVLINHNCKFSLATLENGWTRFEISGFQKV